MSDEAAPVEEINPTAVADEPAPENDKPPKLHQQIDIRDAGPCRKHIKVVIPREDIKDRMGRKFSEMMVDVQVPGYRPGKAPRKLIEKRFQKDVSEQLKAELLLQSLEEMAEDHHLNPITQPQIDPYKIELPPDGPLEYEFEVEVAPEFDLPQYKGLKLKRPVKQITDDEVDQATKRFLRNYGTLKPKDGPAVLEDYLSADVAIKYGDQEFSKFDDLIIRIDPQLAFKDGMANDFGAKMVGVKAGETRTADITLSAALPNPNLRGRVVQGTFTVKEVKEMVLPELDDDFLSRIGVASVEQLHEKVRDVLDKQLKYQQRQSAKQQVLEHIAAAASWDLPRDLLQRQAYKTLQRRVMEMQSAGYSEDEIRSKATLLQQDAINRTAADLKEHFVLQKIGEVEKIEVTDDDVANEIEMLAAQSDESPRRVRARLEKEEMMDTLMTQIFENKALNLVLESAEYEDVAVEAEAPVSAVEQEAVPAAEAAAPEEPAAS